MPFCCSYRPDGLPVGRSRRCRGINQSKEGAVCAQSWSISTRPPTIWPGRADAFCGNLSWCRGAERAEAPVSRGGVLAEGLDSTAVLVLLIGALVAVSIFMRAFLDRTMVPSLVAFIGLGFLLRIASDRWGILGDRGEFAFEVLAELGVIVLLFRIGLESDLSGLRRELGHASVVWLGNIALSAVPGYFVAHYLLGYGQIPSLVTAVALTATSIGVSVATWQQHGKLDTPNGRLLTDVAEMDDLSGVAMMALLFAILPILREAGQGGQGEGLVQELMSAGGVFALKLAGFVAFCVVFSLYVERRMTGFFLRFGSREELTVLVAGTGVLIAGAAALLGFSAAVGALLAGLAFSRDPEAINIDAGFKGLYHLFAPFFFVGIGLSLQPSALTSALAAGAALTVVAVLGKLIGAGLPALVATGTTGAVIIGVSMVPRAEITMVIMERGQQLGDWAVPADLYAAFVLVSAITCLVAPIALSYLFRRRQARRS